MLVAGKRRSVAEVFGAPIILVQRLRSACPKMTAEDLLEQGAFCGEHVDHGLGDGSDRDIPSISGSGEQEYLSSGRHGALTNR